MVYVYEKVAADILNRIQSGEWKQGTQLPTIDKLEKMYPQSRVTLHKALRKLADEGYLSMSRKRGTFVRNLRVRKRVAILTGSSFLNSYFQPFAALAFRYAHRYFSQHGLNPQLYTDDPVAPSGLPAGLLDELNRGQLSGILCIESFFSLRHMRSEHWRDHSVPCVHIGTQGGNLRVDIDRTAFFEQALTFAQQHGKKNVALFERKKEFGYHYEIFRKLAKKHKLTVHSIDAWPQDSLTYEAYGYELFKKYSEKGNPVDAFIIPDDILAKGAVQSSLAENNHSIPPEQFIVLSNRGAKIFYPVPITKIEIDVEEIVSIASSILMDQINSPINAKQTILIKPLPPL